MDVTYPTYMPISNEFLAGMRLGYSLAGHDYAINMATRGLESYGTECMFNLSEDAYAPRSFYEDEPYCVGKRVMDINCTTYSITGSTKNVLVKQ